MFDHSAAYAAFKEKQSKLAKLLGEASETIAVLNMNQARENLKALSIKVNDDSFKIQVVGTFKNGKSTFINSFLGDEILPAYSRPCTAVINEVKYGKEKRAILYFKNPLPKKLPQNIPPKTLEYMKKYGNSPIPPIEIPVTEIEDYAVIPMGKEQKEMAMENPYEKIELFWPLGLLENSVEIIDSPGLNEHETRTQVTTGYLTRADAVLFVLDATHSCAADEMKFIESDLRHQGFEDLYFIVNKFDMIPRREAADLKEYTKMKLIGLTNLGEKGIFFISARKALDGKMDNDEALYLSSGLPEFEESLSKFLVDQKGKAKLAQPARELNRILNEEALFKAIPQQRSMLESKLDDLKKRYEQAKPRLDQLNTRKNQMQQRIELLIEQMMPEIRRYLNKYFEDLNTNIPVWVKTYEANTKISLAHVKQTSNDLMSELTDFVKDKIEEEQKIWRENTFSPLVTDKVQNILTSIEGSLESFFVELDTIKINIAGTEVNTNTVPMWQRVAAAGGGLLLGDIGVATLGSITGFSKDFAKGIALQLGAYIGLALFGLLNPVTIIAVIGISVWNALAGAGNQIEKKVKDAVTTATLKQINEASFDSIEAMVDDIKGKLSNLKNVVVSSMDTEISELRLQVDDIIAQMGKGQKDIDKRKELLALCEKQIQELSKELDAFIFALLEK